MSSVGPLIDSLGVASQILHTALSVIRKRRISTTCLLLCLCSGFLVTAAEICSSTSFSIAKDVCFDNWLARVEARFDGLAKKGLNYIIILGSWMVWEHCNRCVLYGFSSNLAGEPCCSLESCWLRSSCGQ